MFISQIDKRQKQLEPHSEEDDMKNEKFIENLERLYTQIHIHSMDEAREVPNTRIMLGFAAKIIESVQAAQSNSDFIAEQKHFKQRFQNFHNYFVRGGTDPLNYYPDCEFIEE